MPDETLLPVSLDDLVFDISYSLRFHRGKPARPDTEMMARITAERIADHLKTANYVVMRKKPGPRHSTPGRSGVAPVD